MISLGIESGGEAESLGGAELHTERAAFTALYRNGDGTFGHCTSHSIVIKLAGKGARWVPKLKFSTFSGTNR
jgi:hypothetical protein